MPLNKLTLKNTLSPETSEKLLKLKGEAMLLQTGEAELTQKQDQKQDKNPDLYNELPPPQPPCSHQEKGVLGTEGLKEVPTQEKTDRNRIKGLFYETKSWLESTFPKAINFNAPKPLKLGIQPDLLLVSGPCSKTQLRKCLGVYCASRAYLEAIIHGDWRYDLNGEKVEGISQEHKDHALKQLEYKKALWKKNKKYKKKCNGQKTSFHPSA